MSPKVLVFCPCNCVIYFSLDGNRFASRAANRCWASLSLQLSPAVYLRKQNYIFVSIRFDTESLPRRHVY